jgi:hypothetical protein
VRAAEDQRLRDDRDADREAAMSESRADQCGKRQRDRAKHALLHESRLQRQRDRTERRHRAAQDVRVGQRFRRLPPAEPAIGRVIERGDHRELERHEQVPADGAAQHLPRRCGLARPDLPQLRMRAERAARQALRGHERKRVTEAAAHRRKRSTTDLADPERVDRLCGVVTEPRARRPGEQRCGNEAADDGPGTSAGRHSSQCFRNSHSTPRMQPPRP